MVAKPKGIQATVVKTKGIQATVVKTKGIQATIVLTWYMHACQPPENMCNWYRTYTEQSFGC